jgi:hypothetical protein
MCGIASDMATGNPSPAIGAENFLTILGLIERTILPRRLLLFNGAADLVLLAARQRASVGGEHPETELASLESTAAAIVHFCATDQPVTCRLEAVARAPAGYSAVAILNAQGNAGAQGTDGGSRHYHFAADGWPLSAPSDAPFAALAAAARIARAMRGWRALSGGPPETPTLIIATSETLTEDVSVSIGETFTVATTPPAQLGQIVSRWRNRTGDDG